MRTVRATVNRVLLGLVGLLLFGTGGLVLLGGLDLPARWHLDLPAGWPWTGPDDVLLTARQRTRFTDRGWWWPVVIAVLAVLLLLLLWWLLAQFRRRRLGAVLVDTGDGADAVVRGRALEAVLAAETVAVDGVDRAAVALTGRRTDPQVRALVVLAPHADPGTVVRRLSDGAVAHARTSAGLDRLPVEVRLRALRHRAERVS
ncbi:alkaline shock response membrane anchor protein AmaP [Streptomyces sp. NPDC059101]|uniref:alkaline shock response membrane anchor protein AmaP n=1 Tax=unclassified Streptomyces TaxID=2593676 RepID=UPI0015E0B61B|nr:alkaline shock response membrane anchor protein AmaP [Streptomyces sp. CB02959]